MQVLILCCHKIRKCFFPKIDSLILKGYVAERKGERVEMQDAHVIFNDYKSFLPHALHHQIALVTND